MQAPIPDELNGHLNTVHVGDRRALQKLITPALLLDMDIFEANLAAGIALAHGAGKALRPHIKGVKSAAIGSVLAASGATGLCCATLAEAELMAQCDARSLLITSPVAGKAMISRLLALAMGTVEVLAVVDAPETVRSIEEACAASDCSLDLLIDVDVGQKRTGVTSVSALLAIARMIDNSKHLKLRGIQAYYGHLQAIVDFTDRKTRALAAQGEIALCVKALTEAGMPPEIVSGGGTGTSQIDARHGPFTELQLGSFGFMDSTYENVQICETGPNPFRPALFVLGRVVSNRQGDRVTIDIGMKALSLDSGPGKLISSGDAEMSFVFAGDEHGFLMPAEASQNSRMELGLGDYVKLMPSHCDTTLNLHDAIHVMRGDRLEALLPVKARGTW